jgi:hypothetical protein
VPRLSLFLALVIAGAVGSGLAGAQARQAAVPVLAELFTSEGCNSCPPADRLLESLLEEQPVPGVYVVTLSEHVTYWDHQGWKDPFAAQQFTTRQQQYGRRFNVESIYTPQLIVDGASEFVGSDRNAIEHALRRAANTPKPALAVHIVAGDGVLTATASGPGLSVEKDAELLFAVAEDHLVVDVKRGENANKTLRHSGVVRLLQRAKIVAASETATLKLDEKWQRANLRVVAFVQSTKDRRVLSVGSAMLR